MLIDFNTSQQWLRQGMGLSEDIVVNLFLDSGKDKRLETGMWLTNSNDKLLLVIRVAGYNGCCYNTTHVAPNP